MIYVVIGRTGEYSDMSEWPVCWRPTLDEAKEVIAELTRQANEYVVLSTTVDDLPWREGAKHLDAFKRTMLDPYFRHDYTGTSYHVWLVPDGREEALCGEKWRSFEISEVARSVR